jgi:hypothetical protein
MFRTLFARVARMGSAYILVQVTVGVQLGVAIAWAQLALGLPAPAVGALLAPLGLVLVALQYPAALRVFSAPEVA